MSRLRALTRFLPSRRVAAQAPLGAALVERFRQGGGVSITAVRGEGFEYEISADVFFVNGEVDERALERCRGRVLDVGAGAGRHSLALQARGLEVLALDVEPRCADLMRTRGVRDVRCGDVFHLDAAQDGRFDTILLLMESVGIAGSRLGLESLLSTLRALLADGGQVLLDSSPYLIPEYVSRLVREDATGEDTALSGLPGEVEVHFEFGRLRGETFPWLYLSASELAACAEPLGLHSEVVWTGAAGKFLVRLVASAC